MGGGVGGGGEKDQLGSTSGLIRHTPTDWARLKYHLCHLHNL